MEEYITKILTKSHEEIRNELKNLLSQLRDIDEFFKEYSKCSDAFANWLLINNKFL
jgi:hypothetical protein